MLCIEVQCEPVDAALQPQPLRLEGQRLDVARQRVVGLVAMHVDQQAALGRDLAQHLHARRAPSSMVRSKCGMPPTTSTPMSSARLRLSARARRAQIAVLRKGDELQVDVGRDALLHLEQRLDRQQPVVADVDMAADRQQALADRPVAVARARARSPPRRVSSGFSSPHSAMPSSSVPDWLTRGRPERQRRVHVEVAVDEGRRDQPALRVDRCARPRPRCAARPPRSCRRGSAMSTPVRPSGSVALRTIRSKLMPKSYKARPAIGTRLLPTSTVAASMPNTDASRSGVERLARRAVRDEPAVVITSTRSAKRAASVRSCMIAEHRVAAVRGARAAAP